MFLRTTSMVALVPVILRCTCECINQAFGTAIPALSDPALTVCFTLFSLMHAASVLGRQRALLFFASTVVVCFCFEAVGVRTTLYGHYHYGHMLGPMLAGVPIVIPFAWFMMVYPSWMIARVLLVSNNEANAFGLMIGTTVVASLLMTAWDAAMDPMMAAQGKWIWEQHGVYFGVPARNFVGWLATMGTLYLVTGLFVLRRSTEARTAVPPWYAGLPLVAYAFVAMARIFIATPPPVRIFSAFSMGLVVVVALCRVLLSPQVLTKSTQL